MIFYFSAEEQSTKAEKLHVKWLNDHFDQRTGKNVDVVDITKIPE